MRRRAQLKGLIRLHKEKWVSEINFLRNRKLTCFVLRSLELQNQIYARFQWSFSRFEIIVNQQFFFRLSHHVFKVFPWKNPGQGNLKSIYRLGFVHREMQQANCFFISHLQPREMKIDFLANTFNVKSPFVEKINDLITWWRTCHEKKSEKREIHIYNVLIIANNKRVFACVCVFAWLYHATMCNKLHSNRKTID